MSKKSHKKQSVTQAYVLTNDKPRKYCNTLLDFEDCEGAKDKIARLEACLGGLQAMVTSVMTPDKVSTVEWSDLGVDMEEVRIWLARASPALFFLSWGGRWGGRGGGSLMGTCGMVGHECIPSTETLDTAHQGVEQLQLLPS